MAHLIRYPLPRPVPAGANVPPPRLAWDHVLFLANGASWLSLPGEPGDYASTPDSAPLSITGDLDLRARTAANDWTPAVSSDTIIAKWLSTGDQLSYLFAIDTDGTLKFQFSTLGGDGTTKNSTASTGFSDGSTHWIRVTVDVDNGASGNDIKFYTSDNGIDWTQLGTTVTTAGTFNFFDSTAPLEIGSKNDGTADFFTGNVYRAQVFSGINGTVEFKANFTIEAPGTTSFTESSSNAATVTVNQSGDPQAEIVDTEDGALLIPLAFDNLARGVQ